MTTRIGLVGAAGLVLAALAACDNGGKATASLGPAAVAPDQAAQSGGLRWAASQNRTAEAAALAQFQRNGAAFGARSVDDYVAQAAAFTAAPPKGAETVIRANGDRLIYDPAQNTFAVATAEGRPRTMFKPREGAAYWERQKSQAAGRTADPETREG